MRPCPLLELSLAAFALAAAAQARAIPNETLATQLRHCTTVSDPTARLACYDALAGGPAAAASSPASATASPPAASATSAPAATPAPASPSSTPAAPAAPGAPKTADSAEFGVRNGPLQAMQAKRDPQREQKMLAVVNRVATLPRGEVVLTLDNGQIWVQLQPSNFPVKAGDPIEIDVGALGSYVLWQPANRHATKVTRIN
jgi:hypothetical protein